MSTPYRTPADPVPTHDAPVPSALGHRTRALLVKKRELAEGARRTLELRRMLRCKDCAGTGCEACEDQGAWLDTSNVDITIPADTEAGTSITIEGRGDTRADGKGTGDLFVEVTRDAARAKEIEREDRQLAGRQTEWLRVRATTARSRRNQRRGALLGLVALAGVLGAVGGLGYLRKQPIGEPCEKSEDCRSRMCVESTGIRFGPGVKTVITKRCSARCSSQDDCPSGMQCVADVQLLDDMTLLPKEGVRACAPL